jgi:hypothetical protein
LQQASHKLLHSSTTAAAAAAGTSGDTTDDDDDMCIEEVDDVQDFAVESINGQVQLHEDAKLAPANTEKRKHVSCDTH